MFAEKSVTNRNTRMSHLEILSLFSSEFLIERLTRSEVLNEDSAVGISALLHFYGARPSRRTAEKWCLCEGLGAVDKSRTYPGVARCEARNKGCCSRATSDNYLGVPKPSRPGKDRCKFRAIIYSRGS